MSNEVEELEFVIKLRGCPWSTTVDDVIEFFGEECQIMGDRDGIHLVKTSEGRATGECFVEMLTDRDVQAALKKDRQNMGHRYIEVFKVKKVEMQWILRRTRPEEVMMGNNNSNGSYHRGGGGGGGGGHLGYDNECESFIRLRGLPYECTVDDIEQFLDGLEVAPNGIQIVTDSGGKITGEAYVQFISPEMAESALQLDRQSIGHRYVEIFRVTNIELRTFDQLVERNHRPHSYGHRPSPYDRPNRDSRQLMGQQRSGPGPSRYFNRNTISNNGGGGRFGQDNWNSYANEVGSWDHVGGGRNSNAPPPPPLMPGLKPGRRMSDYPLLMRGLPWSATENDIKAFFDPLPTGGIQIIYDETNRPSGSARVFFACADDLNLALRKNKNMMEHRYIELFVE